MDQLECIARVALSLAILELASRLPRDVRLERWQDRSRAINHIHVSPPILPPATAQQLRVFVTRWNDYSSGVSHRHTSCEQDAPPSLARLAALDPLPPSVSIRIVSFADICAMSLLSTPSLLSRGCARAVPPRPSQASEPCVAEARRREARIHGGCRASKRSQSCRLSRTTGFEWQRRLFHQTPSSCFIVSILAPSSQCMNDS